MEIHDDDKPVGRVLSRHEMLSLLGGSGAVMPMVNILVYKILVLKQPVKSGFVVIK